MNASELLKQAKVKEERKVAAAEVSGAIAAEAEVEAAEEAIADEQRVEMTPKEMREPSENVPQKPSERVDVMPAGMQQLIEKAVAKGIETLMGGKGAVMEPTPEPKDDSYIREGRPPLQEARSARRRPTLISLPDEHIDPRFHYRYVHNLKVYNRIAQGYEYVMYKDCPVHVEDAQGHIRYADCVLMRIPYAKWMADMEDRANDSSARVHHMKKGFHAAVEEANREHGSEYVKSFETEKAGKEVF